MKILICFVALASVAFAAALTDEQIATMKKYHKECQKETNVETEMLKKMKDGIFADDPKMKAQLSCVAKKYNFQDEDGKLNMDKIREGLEKRGVTNIEEMMKKCVKEETTPEETAWTILKCWHENKIMYHAQ